VGKLWSLVNERVSAHVCAYVVFCLEKEIIFVGDRFSNFSRFSKLVDSGIFKVKSAYGLIENQWASADGVNIGKKPKSHIG